MTNNDVWLLQNIHCKKVYIMDSLPPPPPQFDLMSKRIREEIACLHSAS